MICRYGKNIPLHKRYDKHEAIIHIKNRYQACRRHISKQVAELQKCKKFKLRCKKLYSEGYKDWVILSVVLNCMLNWKAKEEGISIDPETFRNKTDYLLDKLNDTVYPCKRFTTIEFEIHMHSHFNTVLVTWGFEFRRYNFASQSVVKFLRDRMRHFDNDLPHKELFGEPIGYWPNTH